MGDTKKDAEGKTTADKQLESKNAQDRIKGAANKALENYKNGMGVRDSLKSGVSSLAQANRDAVPANWTKSKELKMKEADEEANASSNKTVPPQAAG
jgi:protoporphyrinogen oxidase